MFEVTGMKDEICMLLNDLSTDDLGKIRIIIALLKSGWTKERIQDLLSKDR